MNPCHHHSSGNPVVHIAGTLFIISVANVQQNLTPLHVVDFWPGVCKKTSPHSAGERLKLQQRNRSKTKEKIIITVMIIIIVTIILLHHNHPDIVIIVITVLEL